MAQSGRAIDPVPIVAPDPLPAQGTSFLQVADNALHGTLGDSHLGGNFPQWLLRCTGQTDQYMGMVAEICPALTVWHNDLDFHLTLFSVDGIYALKLAKSTSLVDGFIMDLTSITLGLFAAAAMVPLWHKLVGKGTALVAATVPLTAFIWFCTCIGPVYQGDFPAVMHSWVAELGVNWSMRLDGLSLLFALLISGIGTLILLYTGGYFSGDKELPRILGLLMFFMASMQGLVLADNLILMFIFWELTSISSYLLIGFKHENDTSRRNALQALLVTGLGGLALLVGVILLGMAAGTYEASQLAAASDQIMAHPLLPLALGCILLGAFTKSAQFPFHFWLPNAMAAPTPVSAYLHSATMVKAGVYLLARLNPTLATAPGWSDCLFAFGATTMLLGGALGLLQTDLKRILAYTTLSVLGMLTMLIGVGTELALTSAIFFLLGHALYKAALFLTAGNVDHACHSRDVTRLRGLRFTLPVTALAAGLAAFSKSGFPPFFGFLGKEYAYKSGAALNEFSTPVLVVAFIGNLILLALALKAGIHPYFGKPEEARLDSKPHGLPWLMWLPPLLLGLLGLAMGLLPAVLSKPVVQAAVSAVEGQTVQLKAIHVHELLSSFSLPLLLTVLTIGCGIALYRFRWLIWRQSNSVVENLPVNFDRIYDSLMAGMVGFAKWQTRAIQNGKLHRYLASLVVATTALLGWKLIVYHGLPVSLPELPVQPLMIGVVIITGLCAFVAITTTSRLTALATLGLAGYGIAYIFANYGATDLAITQIVVETLTVLFFMTLFHRLPKIKEYSNRRTKLADALLAAVSGILVSLIFLISVHVQIAEPISNTLAEWSYLEAYGRNVVNVILVDFRALDTLGEITVLGIAAVGVYLLLTAFMGRRNSQQQTPVEEKNE